MRPLRLMYEFISHYLPTGAVHLLDILLVSTPKYHKRSCAAPCIRGSHHATLPCASTVPQERLSAKQLGSRGCTASLSPRETKNNHRRARNNDDSYADANCIFNRI